MNAVLRFLCLLTAVGLSVSCSSEAPEEVESDTVVPVMTQPASLGTIRAVIHATGLVTPAPGADLVIVAPEPGRIAEMPKAEGDRVRRGDLLVRFEFPSTRAEAARQEAEVTRAQANLETARAAQARAHELFDKGVAARRDMEDADRAVTDAEAALTQAQASRTAADALAERAVVRATFEGIVAKRYHNPGDLVEAAAADPVMRIIDPRRLEVTASVPISDVPRVALGAAARRAGGPDEAQVPMRVTSLPAAVEPGTATVPVRLALQATAMLPTGTPLQIEIDAEEHKTVVLVPSDAIVREGEETAVFVAEGDKAHRRPVVIGLENEEHAELRSGVKAGEQIIVAGQAGLPDGATISVEPPEAAGGPAEK
jgi:membrane fusion protein (multidrug efflux system)